MSAVHVSIEIHVDDLGLGLRGPIKYLVHSENHPPQVANITVITEPKQFFRLSYESPVISFLSGETHQGLMW